MVCLATLCWAGLTFTACDNGDDGGDGDGGGSGTPAAVTLQLVTSTVRDPVHVAHASENDGRLFIVEQQGRIWILRDGQVLPTPFLDIQDKVSCCGERGLLSVAFHPAYPTKPYFYVYYNNRNAADGGINAVFVARFQVSANPDVADRDSFRKLLDIAHPGASNHNGGQVAFGPDGRLYAGTGDGGGACDNTGRGCNAQRDDTLLGKMLRLDIDQNENTAPFYGIPSDNPFRGAGDPLDEIWSKGLRNPFRFSFDRETGDLYIADVGQVSQEEIDFAAAGDGAGRNYGWPFVEGDPRTGCNTCPQTLPRCPVPNIGCGDTRLVPPIHSYGRRDGTVVIGGFVYRGAAIPGLRGFYIFGDAGTGRIWALSNGNRQRFDLLNGAVALSSFGEDKDGEVYACVLSAGQSQFRGGVYRLVARNQAATKPAPASASGASSGRAQRGGPRRST